MFEKYEELRRSQDQKGKRKHQDSIKQLNIENFQATYGNNQSSFQSSYYPQGNTKQYEEFNHEEFNNPEAVKCQVTEYNINQQEQSQDQYDNIGQYYLERNQINTLFNKEQDKYKEIVNKPVSVKQNNQKTESTKEDSNFFDGLTNYNNNDDDDNNININNNKKNHYFQYQQNNLEVSGFLTSELQKQEEYNNNNLILGEEKEQQYGFQEQYQQQQQYLYQQDEDNKKEQNNKQIQEILETKPNDQNIQSDLQNIPIQPKEGEISESMFDFFQKERQQLMEELKLNINYNQIDFNPQSSTKGKRWMDIKVDNIRMDLLQRYKEFLDLKNKQQQQFKKEQQQTKENKKKNGKLLDPLKAQELDLSESFKKVIILHHLMVAVYAKLQGKQRRQEFSKLFNETYDVKKINGIQDDVYKSFDQYKKLLLIKNKQMEMNEQGLIEYIFTNNNHNNRNHKLNNKKIEKIIEKENEKIQAIYTQFGDELLEDRSLQQVHEKFIQTLQKVINNLDAGDYQKSFKCVKKQGLYQIGLKISAIIAFQLFCGLFGEYKEEYGLDLKKKDVYEYKSCAPLFKEIFSEWVKKQI